MAARRASKGDARKFDAGPDPVDFRDLMYMPRLVEVPAERSVDAYKATYRGQWNDTFVLDQGRDGACTGFGLAAVVNYLLQTRSTGRAVGLASPTMLYCMARRHDEWPGEEYDGSTARAAMKGWHKHGVCAEALWPIPAAKTRGSGPSRLTQVRAAEASSRPLGAYYRVNHKDLVAMHASLVEVGILYAVARVHQGWLAVRADGRVPFRPGDVGGHAFAVVGYDVAGFWIQNSWGPDRGAGGFYHLSYHDWLQNGNDVWVARLGAPVHLQSAEATAAGRSPAAFKAEAYTFADLRPHIISIDNDGRPQRRGAYANSAEEIAELIRQDIPRAMAGWGHKRLLLYAHGGLTDESTAVQHLAEFRARMLGQEIFPLMFVWHSDFWTTVRNLIEDILRSRKTRGVLDAATNFMLDRLDDSLEVAARGLGRVLWEEMKENAAAASDAAGGAAAIAVAAIVKVLQQHPNMEVHVAGHSAGANFLGPLVRALCRRHRLETLQLWAPAISVEQFKDEYVPVLRRKQAIRRFAMFCLSEQAELDDNVASVYHKSLLYLVSHSFERRARNPWMPKQYPGTPIVGLATSLRSDQQLSRLFRLIEPGNARAQARLHPRVAIVCPNNFPSGSPYASGAKDHGGFDDDEKTVSATMARILGRSTPSSERAFCFRRSAGSLRNVRRCIDAVSEGKTVDDATKSS